MSMPALANSVQYHFAVAAIGRHDFAQFTVIGKSL